MRRALSALAVALLALPAAAREYTVAGEPLRLDVTETARFDARLDPGSGNPANANYYALFSRLNLQLAWRGWSAGLRVDSSGFFDIPQVGEQLARGNCPECIVTVKGYELTGRFPMRPFDHRKFFEKLSIGYSGRNVEATLGDFYAQFGRGLVLSARKVDELGSDTTIFGGKVTVRAGDLQAVALAGLGNTQNVDEATATYIPDPDDLVGGARVQYRFAQALTLGVQAAGGLAREGLSPLSKDQDRYLRYGISADAPRALPWLGLYGEYARGHDRIFDSTRRSGALYASATAFAGRATWLLEFKDYRDYRPWFGSGDPFKVIGYQLPPTLERVQIPLTTNSDVTAGRVRVDLRRDAALSVFASAELGELRPTSVVRHSLYDAYAGAQLRWNGARSHLFPLVEVRREQDSGTGKLAEQLVSLELNAGQALDATWALETTGLLWLREKATGDAWREGYVHLAVRSRPSLLASIGYEFTTSELERLNQHHFVNGQVLWNMTPNASIRVFAGGQRPGLACISGTCRVFPAFQGAKVELVFRD